jgi:outer membrane protein X
MKTKRILKRMAICLIATTTMSVMAAEAQEQGDMAAGVNLYAGFGNSYTNFGIGAKFQYNVTSPIRLEGAFNYFPKKDLISMWDLSLNGHYLFPLTDKFTFYPLVGIGVTGSKVQNISYGFDDYIGKKYYSSSNVAFNLGVGVDYMLTDNIFANFEIKYKISDGWDRTLFSLGIAYKFRAN